MPSSTNSARRRGGWIRWRHGGARHVIAENSRVEQTARAIQAADWATVGELMYASHASLRDDYEVSCAELDAVVDIARGLGSSAGVLGCRMTGAGFGGCAICLIRSEVALSVTRRLGDGYERKTGSQALIFSSRPAGRRPGFETHLRAGGGGANLRPLPPGLGLDQQRGPEAQLRGRQAAGDERLRPVKFRRIIFPHQGYRGPRLRAAWHRSTAANGWRGPLSPACSTSPTCAHGMPSNPRAR